jgi:hypothetical protein
MEVIAIYNLIYFLIAVVNNLLLISLFLFTRFGRLDIVKKIGNAYFSLIIPAIYLLALSGRQEMSIQYSIFLSIFIVFALLEFAFDFLFKIEFRTDFRENWKYLIPYLVLYYAMNYGLCIMVWKNSLTKGVVIVFLFGIQIVANILSHKIVRPIRR